MTSLTALFIVLALMLLMAGGKKGIQAIFSLLGNFVWLFLIITLIAWNFEPVIIIVVFGLIILATTIFLSDDNDQVTRVAFLASFSVLIILIILILPLDILANVQGFSNENSEELEGLSLTIGISFIKITMVATILATLGAIAEATMAVAAGMQEILADIPMLPIKELFGHGMHIGQQIISTAINTIFFGFIGSNLGLTIWFIKLNYSLELLINTKIFVGEVLMLLISMIAVTLAVPITVLVMQRDIKRHRVKQ